MSGPILSANDLTRLTALAEVLVPGADKLPPPRGITNFHALLQTGVNAFGITDVELRDALAALPSTITWDNVRAFSTRAPQHFENLATIVSGAYVLAQDVFDALGFPAERRNPSGTMDAANEYETGILEPVINRGKFFHDPR